MANIVLSLSSDLEKVLTPGTLATRAATGKMRKPWTYGYALRCETTGTGILVGVSRPADNDITKRNVLQGLGTAGTSASAYTYTLPTGTGITLPTSADVTAASVYANAILLAYAPGDRSNATIVPRVATGGANLAAGPFWRTETGTTFTTVAGGTTGAFTDWALNYVLELIVPAAGDITTLFDQASTAGPLIVPARGFYVAGDSGKTGNVILTRARS